MVQLELLTVQLEPVKVQQDLRKPVEGSARLKITS